MTHLLDAVAGADEYLVYGRTTGGQNMYWKTTDAVLHRHRRRRNRRHADRPMARNGRSRTLFELKNAQDVLVEGNVFENLWVADQTGYPIVFTPRNQGGRAPWAVVQRITFQNNLVRHTAGGVNILGTDNLAPSQRTNHDHRREQRVRRPDQRDLGHRVAVRSSSATAPTRSTIDHNTIVTTDTAFIWLYGGSVTSPTREHERHLHEQHVGAQRLRHHGDRLSASGCRRSTPTCRAACLRGNVLAGGSAANYPTGNFFPTAATGRRSSSTTPPATTTC